MSDLSRVLGDLYGGAGDADQRPSVAPARNFRDATAPEWADDEHLDQAFENWTPGPPPEAPAAEHAMSSYVIDTPAVPPAHLEDDLAATLGQALADAGPSPSSEPEVPVASAPTYAIPAMGEDPATMSFGDGFPVDTAVAPIAPLAAPVEAPSSMPAAVAAELPTMYDVPAMPELPERLAPTGPWQRSHDDILPGHVGKLPKLPKAPKAKAPKAPKQPKAKKGEAAPVEALAAPVADAMAPFVPAEPAEPKAKKGLKLGLPKKGLKAEKAPKAPKAEGDVPTFFGIKLRRK
jgi:hypothetical protein